jgi:hypothetical protein
MRNFFLILLFANLLLLAWMFWVDPEPRVAARAMLVNELAVFGKAAPVAAVTPNPVDARSDCLFVGPVPDLNAAQQLSASLAARGVKVEPVPREGRVWLGHWVQIQGFVDRAAAEVARESLLKAGLPDAYVMQDGLLNIVSLGVFRERERAESVVEDARQAGFEALMRERIRTATEYWLMSSQASGQPAALGELAASFDRILRAETGPCLSQPLSPEEQ